MLPPRMADPDTPGSVFQNSCVIGGGTVVSVQRVTVIGALSFADSRFWTRMRSWVWNGSGSLGRNVIVVSAGESESVPGSSSPFTALVTTTLPCVTVLGATGRVKTSAILEFTCCGPVGHPVSAKFTAGFEGSSSQADTSKVAMLRATSDADERWRTIES